MKPQCHNQPLTPQAAKKIPIGTTIYHRNRRSTAKTTALALTPITRPHQFTLAVATPTQSFTITTETAYNWSTNP